MTIQHVGAFRVHTNIKTDMKELILGTVLRIVRIHTENLSFTPKKKKEHGISLLFVNTNCIT